MANRWLFAGGRVANFRNTGAVADSTNSNLFDATYSDSAFNCSASGQRGIADFVDTAGASDAATTGETLYVHGRFFMNGATNTAGQMIAVLDGSDQPWLSIRTTTTSGSVGFYYNSGTGASPVWTLIGSIFVLSTGVGNLHDYDIVVTLGSPHSAELFIDAVSKASGTFTQASFTSADAVALEYFQGNTGHSQVMAAIGFNTIGGKLPGLKASGAGSNSGWSGAYTDVNEAVGNDATLMSAASAALKTTLAFSNLPTVPSGYILGNAFYWLRCKNDGAAPLNIKPVKRISGVDTTGSALSGVNTGLKNLPIQYAGLSASDINGGEFGFESAT